MRVSDVHTKIKSSKRKWQCSHYKFKRGCGWVQSSRVSISINSLLREQLGEGMQGHNVATCVSINLALQSCKLILGNVSQKVAKASVAEFILMSEMIMVLMSLGGCWALSHLRLGCCELPQLLGPRLVRTPLGPGYKQFHLI